MWQTFTLSTPRGRIADFTVTLSGSSAFAITDDTCSGVDVSVAAQPASRTCSVTVSYSPASASDSATLTVDGRRPMAEASVSLTGSGAFHFVATGPAAPGLSPLNENPQHPESSGSGTADVTWDTTTNMMTVNVAFSGLLGNTTASHIHCCAAAPATAGVATTTPTFPNFPLGVKNGTYSRTFDMTSAGSYNPSFVSSHGAAVASAEAALFAGMLAGQTYLNVHSSSFPGGELRGFLQQSS